MTDLHRHDRRRVIGLVLAGCVLVGGLGAVAGEVFDPPAEHPRKARTNPGLGVTVTQGNAAPRARAATLLRLDGTTQDPNLTGVELRHRLRRPHLHPVRLGRLPRPPTPGSGPPTARAASPSRRSASTPTRRCGPAT